MFLEEKSNDACRETLALWVSFTKKRKNTFILQFGIFKGQNSVPRSVGAYLEL